ncbi:DNA recombination protein RmuC [Brevibacterium sp. UCMA 11754]|uniref:DNA recombination protein RmuC n=1 Tax=Brevibacterium sp. UCMA 11754 TaxID=2749198 RepID=UPI001F40BE03|nr:DNA recombination protein RmuC [Brevibacterium sp. UCMA 11754]MCF2570973.1 DNA recombination protein RmuC [Brevibacterium sp. UCMA 11754]MCF2570975.1 DNA recombination protein RmuC [Brevibacterium sp. UCMA 11754]MCF2574173.1 DNA recombination protein RmuC [Brevibacterium sp. UCMA 11754]
MNSFPATGVIVVLILAIIISVVLGFLLGRAHARSRYIERLTRAETTSRILTSRTEDLEADAQMAGEITAAIGPLAASVNHLQENLQSQDRTQLEQITRLNTQIGHLSQQNLRLQESTGSLASALNSTTQRGDWGEVQLKRIVEYAGLLPHVDFETQVSSVRDGKRHRPDMTVNLPGGGTIIIDAKTPLSARMDSTDSNADDHARALLRHIDSLASKEYWKSFDSAPDFVVCFVPTDGLLSSAASTYPKMIDHALGKNVVLASPATLLVLLKTVALNWRQADMSTSAAEVLKLGTELYERIGTLVTHVTRMGSSLDRSVEDYNRFVSSLESRFLVTARKFPNTGIVATELDAVAELDSRSRGVSAEELTRPSTAGQDSFAAQDTTDLRRRRTGSD